eukprot:TRINITY_DN7371_c0_g3_i2.p1 TRINITY_DN7371_c0_g3~~TRINITY_DN7371_c0_g3_i2.p1  ORF type:complete len:126 (+),score=20.69 TRINITY_DN7371_c0_g3_i2:536-913(+)
MFDGAEAVFFIPRSPNAQFFQSISRPFAQVEVLFDTKTVLSLEGSETVSPSAEVHRILFENHPEDTQQFGGLDILKLVGSMGLRDLANIQKDPSTQLKLLKQMMFSGNYSWKIADIDDFMGGNPL